MSSGLFAQIAPHLDSIKQLTFGGQNAEAYWAPDGKRLIFQSTRDKLQCDQIFVMNADGSDQHMVSNGKGRTTDRKSTRLNSSHDQISYAVFCLKKKID